MGNIKKWMNSVWFFTKILEFVSFVALALSCYFIYKNRSANLYSIAGLLLAYVVNVTCHYGLGKLDMQKKVNDDL